MSNQTEQALRNLLTGTASGEEIELLKQALSNGQVSIGGNVSQSVIILGDGNTVQLTPQALEALNGRSLLGDLERDLTGAEVEFGLTRLAELLPERAPTLKPELETLTRCLRPSLKTDPGALGSEARAERTAALARLNQLCLEITDIAFNALCTGIKPPDYDSNSPFRGLESFRPEDAPYFFGRETLTRKLVQKLNEHNFLAVLGASGSGKSSLVMAGLIPALNVPYATPALHRTQCGASVFRPGAEPLAELEKALQGNPALLVVDQFEELFTLSAREQRAEFISRLLEQSQRLRVVITLRADFLGEVAPFKSLKDEVQSHQEIIPPMDEVELRRAMEGQAGCAGLRFESDLSQQMLDDVSGEPGAMPLLQFALLELWNRRHGRWLRAEEYRAFGGVKQAIASTAEAVFAHCTDFEKERLRDIFLRLTRLDDSADGRDTRRRILLHDLIPADSDPAATTLLVKQLADARLVVVTGDEVEVAHEALIRHWERLRAWLNDDRDNLRLREGVSDDARRWENAARDESLLNHRGPRLELALAMSKNPRYRLNPVEQAYLDGCVGLREREKAAAAKRRRYTIAGVSAALVVIMAILAGWGITNKQQVGIAQTAQVNAEIEKRNAQENAKNARSGELAALALAEKDSHLDLGLLLAAESIRLQENARTENSLFSLIDYRFEIAHYLFGHNDDVSSVAFSPNGKILASASSDQTIILWDLTNSVQPVRLFTLAGYTNFGEKVTVAFSPDGIILASGNAGLITLWDVSNPSSPNKLSTLPGNYNYPPCIAFSPDGGNLATGNYDGEITIWNIKEPKNPVPMFAMPGHYSVVSNVIFSPNGRMLASTGPDNQIVIWGVNGEAVPTKLSTTSGHKHGAAHIAFSPDSKRLVSAGGYDDDSDIIIWDVSSSLELNKLYTLSENHGGVSDISFSPDGQRLVSGNSDSSIIVWDVSDLQTNPAKLSIYSGHLDSILDIAFSPDGKRLISGSEDNTIILWNMDNSESPAKKSIVWGHDSAVSSISFSEDGSSLISGSDESVIIWDMNSSRDPTKKSTLSRGINIISSRVSFSPAGKKLAMVSNNIVTIWDFRDLNNPDQLATIPESIPIITSISIGSDGRFLVLGGINNTISLWDIRNPQMPDNLFTHSEEFISDTSSIIVLVISSDSKLLAAGNEIQTIDLWNLSDPANPVKSSVISGLESSVFSLAFSPDGTQLAASEKWNGKITLWNVVDPENPQKMASISGINEFYTGIAFSSDGKYLASGDNKGNISIWNIQTPKNPVKLFTLSNHDYTISSLAFSPDGKKIVSGNEDKSIVIWDLNRASWIEKACQRAGRNFTRAEWAQYFPDEPYRATCTQWLIEPEPTPTPTP